MQQNLTLRRAVLTGPTGAIGTALCRLLLERDVEVFAVCHRGSRRTAQLPQSPRLHVISCDLEELGDLAAQVPGGADVLFHFAWAHTIGPGRNDMPAQIQNIAHTIDAVRAAQALGCHTFLGAGSQAEYGRVEGLMAPDTPVQPETGYGMAKLCAGQMSRVECERLGLRHIWPRILSIYGPGDGEKTMISTVIRTLLAGKRPACTPAEQLWDYLYAGDAAEAFYAMALRGRDGAVYPLGSGHAVPLRQYIETLRDAIDPELPLGLGDIPYGDKQIMHLQADLTDLTADTGFAPRTAFPDGIRRTIDWMEQHE